MKNFNKSIRRSKLRMTVIITIGFLLLGISTINAQGESTSLQKYQNRSIFQSDYSKSLFNTLSTRQTVADKQVNNVGFNVAAPGEISFDFSGYGNPQRPFPGYQGRFQLGPVWISGKGVVRARDGKLLRGGYIVHRDDLLAGRYRNHRTNWRVVRGLGVDSKNGVTVLRLLVRVSSSNYPRICPVGTMGVITLTDNNRLMNNRQTRDSIRTQMPNPSKIAPDGGAACRTHVHGMNNVNYSWTNPPRGGPGGGNRARVQIKVEGNNVGICNISGSWRQRTRGVSTSTWTFTSLGGNRYRATESGSGNARGTAVLTGNKLRLNASTGNLRGYYLWTINRNCRAGNGKLVFTSGRRGTYSSSISRLTGTVTSIGNDSLSRYRRYPNSGINASFIPKYFYRNVSVGRCSVECNKYSWCRGFEYIPSRKYCYLHRSSARKTKRGVVAYIKQ